MKNTQILRLPFLPPPSLRVSLIIVEALGASKELISRWTWDARRLRSCQMRSLSPTTDVKNLATMRQGGSVSFVIANEAVLRSPLVGVRHTISVD